MVLFGQSMFSIIIRLPEVSNPDALWAAINHSLPRTARVTSGINRILCMRKGVGASGIHGGVTWRHRHEPVIGRNDCLLHLLVMNLTNVGSAAGVVHPACRTSGHDENGYCEHSGMCGPGPHGRTKTLSDAPPSAPECSRDGTGAFAAAKIGHQAHLQLANFFSKSCSATDHSALLVR